MPFFVATRRFLPAVCMTLLSLASTAPAADRPEANSAPATVSLPDGAFGDDVQAVLWLDLPALTPEKLTGAQHALLDALTPMPKGEQAKPDEARNRMDQEMKAGMGQVLKFRDAAMNAGAQAVVLGYRAPSAGAKAGDNGASPQDAVVFVRMNEGADPQALFQAMRMFAAVRKQANAVAGKGGGGDAADPDAFEPGEYDAKRWSGQWFSVTGPKLAAPAAPRPGEQGAAIAEGEPGGGPRSITQSFAQALAHEEGAPLRAAFRMNDAARQQITDALQSPNATMLRGLGEPLLAMRTASLGLSLGDRPRLRLGLHFADAQQAGQFKATLDRTVTMVSAFASFAAMGNQNPNNGAAGGNQQQTPIKPEVIQAAIAPLMMQQDGPDLTTSIDTTFVARLRELGLGATPAAPASRANPGEAQQ